MAAALLQALRLLSLLSLLLFLTRPDLGELNRQLARRGGGRGSPRGSGSGSGSGSSSGVRENGRGDGAARRGVDHDDHDHHDDDDHDDDETAWWQTTLTRRRPTEPWPRLAMRSAVAKLASPSEALDVSRGRVRDDVVVTRAEVDGVQVVGVLGKWVVVPPTGLAFEPGKHEDDEAAFLLRGVMDLDVALVTQAASSLATKTMQKWEPHDDVALANTLLALSWVAHAAAAWDAYWWHAPDLRKPWTLLVSVVATPSLLALVDAFGMISLTGAVVRQAAGSSALWWSLFALGPMAVTAAQLVWRGTLVGFSLGSILPVFSLLVFGALKEPHALFRVPGLDEPVRFPGLVVMHIALSLLVHSTRPPEAVLGGLLGTAFAALALFYVWFPTHPLWRLLVSAPLGGDY